MPLVKREIASPAAALADAEPAIEATLEQLLADLRSPVRESRRGAARRLGAYPAAAGALCAAVEAEDSESVRESIFTALIRIATKSAATGLVALLKSEDVGLRNGAIEALKTMPGPASECIGEIFAGSTDVRVFGVEILGALAHPDSPMWLTQVIEADSNLNVCSVAVDALAECGDQSAVQPLLALLERFPDEPFLEFAVRSAIARIGSV